MNSVSALCSFMREDHVVADEAQQFVAGRPPRPAAVEDRRTGFSVPCMNARCFFVPGSRKLAKMSSLPRLDLHCGPESCCRILGSAAADRARHLHLVQAEVALVGRLHAPDRLHVVEDVVADVQQQALDPRLVVQPVCSVLLYSLVRVCRLLTSCRAPAAAFSAFSTAYWCASFAASSRALAASGSCPPPPKKSSDVGEPTRRCSRSLDSSPIRFRMVFSSAGSGCPLRCRRARIRCSASPPGCAAGAGSSGARAARNRRRRSCWPGTAGSGGSCRRAGTD